MASRVLLVLGIAFVLIGASPLSADAQPILTFNPKYEAKLFISTIPAVDCAISAVRVVGVAPTPAAKAKRAAFIVFCKATSLGENPPTGSAAINPLDARIAGGVNFSFRCQVGNPLPLAPATLTAGPTAAGREGRFLLGVVNPPAIRDKLAATGKFGFVLSGHPHRFVEPVFQAFRARANPDIWQRLYGTVACGVDSRGLPTATIGRTLRHTKFPSHRLWFYSKASTPAPGRRVINTAQISFGDLWFLPVVPAP